MYLPSALAAPCWVQGAWVHQDHKCHKGRLALVKGTSGWLSWSLTFWCAGLVREAGEIAQPEFLIQQSSMVAHAGNRSTEGQRQTNSWGSLAGQPLA